MNIDFSLNNAISILENNIDQKFKVNFDRSWRWCEYTRKDSAKKLLVRNFVENLDYCIDRPVAETNVFKAFSRLERILVTLPCAKKFAMLCQTKKGKLVRNYFVEAENQLLQIKYRTQIVVSGVELSEAEIDREILRKVQLVEEGKRRLSLLNKKIESINLSRELFVINSEIDDCIAYISENSYVEPISPKSKVSQLNPIEKQSLNFVEDAILDLASDRAGEWITVEDVLSVPKLSKVKVALINLSFVSLSEEGYGELAGSSSSRQFKMHPQDICLNDYT